MNWLDHNVDVVLIGGPDDLPEMARRARAPAGDATIKVLHRGGYEHFERDEAGNGPGPLIFRWTMRTWIAE